MPWCSIFAPQAQIAAVADGVGAAHVRIAERQSAWASGAAVARRDWLLCLAAGDVPQEGWIGGIEAYLAGASGPGLGRARRGGALPPGQPSCGSGSPARAKSAPAISSIARSFSARGCRGAPRPARLDARIATPHRPNRKQ